MNRASPESKEKPLDSYDVLRHRVARLHWHWHIWRQLFRDGQDKKKLMRDMAPSFFRVVHTVLAGDVLLSVMKLLDPKQGRPGRGNLVLEEYIEEYEEWREKNEATTERLRTLWEQLQEARLSLKIYRDRVLAHDDKKVATLEEPLDPIHVGEIDKAVEACVVVMEILDKQQRPGESFAYRDMIAPGDAEALLALLDRLRRYIAADQERFQNRLLE